MKKKDIACAVSDILDRIYPDAICALDYRAPHELLIAARLSAQCTDARVNIVTKTLFEKYASIESFAGAKIEDVEDIIRPCGLFHTKAKDIVNMCSKLLTDFDGQLPRTMEELTGLPGVGRKTANLIMGDVFGEPAIVTDTHCIRVCGRLGLSTGTNPLKVENQLRKILDPAKSNDFCHRIVLFGRDVCKARSPKCGECDLREVCLFQKVQKPTLK